MFTRIHIKGLGALAEATLDLDPKGTTVIAGPSEAGKTTLAHALAFSMWGCDGGGQALPHQMVRDEHERAEVQLTTGNGTSLRRTMTRARSQTWLMENGEKTRFSSHSAYAEQLGPVAQQADLARIISMPGYLGWQPMLGVESGRKLRDLLLTVLPAVDEASVVAELMSEAGYEMRSGDPKTEKLAVTSRRSTNSMRDQRRGELLMAQRLLETVDTEMGAAALLEPDDLEWHRACLAAQQAWVQHDHMVAGYERSLAEYQQRRDRWVKWTQGMEKIGECPPAPEAEVNLDHLRAVMDKAEARVDWLSMPRKKTEGELRLSLEIDGMEAKHAKGKGAEVCTDCPLLTNAADLDAKLNELRGLQEQEDEHHVDRLENARRDLEEVKDQWAVAQAGRDGQKAARRAWRGWQELYAQLGHEPDMPGNPPALPVKPDSTRPDEAALSASRDALQGHANAKAQLSMLEEQARKAKADVALKQKQLEEEDAEACRLDALVKAYRRAPAVVAQQHAERLGDLGPVDLRFTGSRALDVLIDGRPWWLASRGRQVCADLHLRAGLRRAWARSYAGAGWLPIVVDDAQCWTGEWPSVVGPVWMLRTLAGGELEVL